VDAPLSAGHNWFDIAVGIILTACGWLIVRLVGRVDIVEEKAEEHSEEIRDTRQAVSRIEGHLHLSPFPYKN
jgi:hypothetical protein